MKFWTPTLRIWLLWLFAMLVAPLVLAACAGGEQPLQPTPLQPTPIPTTVPTVSTPSPVVSETPAPPTAPAETPVATNTNTGTQAVITGTAIVQRVDVLLLESFPVQVSAVAKGYLPDGCTTLGDIVQTRTGNSFTVTLTTSRPADRACTYLIQPFEERIPLDALGLKAGAYTVTINGMSANFELQADNIPVTPIP